jgi:hypothetical protein
MREVGINTKVRKIMVVRIRKTIIQKKSGREHYLPPQHKSVESLYFFCKDNGFSDSVKGKNIYYLDL